MQNKSADKKYYADELTVSKKYYADALRQAPADIFDIAGEILEENMRLKRRLFIYENNKTYKSK